MSKKIGHIDIRPWGSWVTLDFGEDFHVKKIVVLPKKRLSLQSHQFRSEHWVIVLGIANVQIDDSAIILNQQMSIDIAQNSKHRLSNQDNANLIIIETQFGNYLHEDDIIRYEDDFGRV